MIDRDFAFRGGSAANKLSKYRDHGPGRGIAGTIRTQRAHAARPRVGRWPEAAPGCGARRFLRLSSVWTRARARAGGPIARFLLLSVGAREGRGVVSPGRGMAPRAGGDMG